MKIIEIFYVTKRGYVLITDKEISQKDWSDHRKAIRIQVIDEERMEFEVLSVELTLRKGIDYLSYVISEDLGTEMVTRLHHRAIKPIVGKEL